AYNSNLNGGAGGFQIASAISAQSFVGGTLTVLTNMSGAAFNEAQASISSSGTTHIGGAAATYLFLPRPPRTPPYGTDPAGTRRILRCVSTGGVFTNNANIVVPGGANYTWQAGDMFGFVTDGAGVWRVFGYALASGKALVASSSSSSTLNQRVFVSTGTF